MENINPLWFIAVGLLTIFSIIGGIFWIVSRKSVRQTSVVQTSRTSVPFLKTGAGVLASLILIGLIWHFRNDILAFSLFWKLTVSLGALWIGMLIKKRSAAVGTVLQWVGGVALVATLLTSGFGSLVERQVNAIDTKMASGALASCSRQPPLIVEPGARITMTLCPQTIDQRRMRGATDFVLVDPALRATTGNLQLVTFSQTDGSNIFTLIPNEAAFKRLGLESVEIEFYPAGTGKREAAKRHGEVQPLPTR